jgi:hypothetical protein
LFIVPLKKPVIRFIVSDSPNLDPGEYMVY